tara:strand:- start:179 stop:394 length:216 start_codon:yes stop_codon:yes gene_type:complete
MKTYIVQKNIFNTERILEDLSGLVSLWEEENMEISSDDEKSKHLKDVEKNIRQKLTEFEKYYQKIKENISF